MKYLEDRLADAGLSIISSGGNMGLDMLLPENEAVAPTDLELLRLLLLLGRLDPFTPPVPPVCSLLADEYALAL